MGNDHGKHSKHEKAAPVQKQPDMNEVLINMRMKAKMFDRESAKALKEKDKYYKQAKDALQKGNEEGAHMFLELAQQKQNEYMQYLRLSHRLQALQGQLSSKTKNVDMINDLSKFTPILMEQNMNMPVEQMYMKLEGFSQAYDDLSIKGNILEDGMEKTLGEKGGYKNVDNMMNGLKAEVQMDMGIAPEQAPAQQQQAPQQDSNNDFYANLKNL